MPSTIKEQIASLLVDALHAAQRAGRLPHIEFPDPAVERPQNQGHGDYASSLPLKLARAARMAPVQIAQTIVDAIPTERRTEFSEIEVAPPGFINFTLDPAWVRRQVDVILSEGARFGHSAAGRGERVQLEFVSVNPTGPIHVGHGRGAVLGSALANILAAAGYDVFREYYINDAGNQMENFNRSVWVRYLQALGREAELPSEGYHGAYMVDLGRDLAREHGDRFLKMGEPEGVAAIGEVGMQRMLQAIRADLEQIRVGFDQWFSERSLFSSGTYEKALGFVKEKGFTTEREGALWFTSTAFGEEKDDVLVRRTGVPTYFASDIAYHYDKFLVRRFQRVVNVWGADHQGHVTRMKAVVKALGVDPDLLQFIIVQLVTLKRGEEVVRVSKRTGDLITLREVIEEVGADACRYFFLARSADAQMDFDLDLAKREAPENPVYYIQYAHARIASILRGAREQGLTRDSGDVSLLTEEAEDTLIREMLRFPEVVQSAALNLEPHHLPHYTLGLAGAFHDFYTKHRVLGVTPELTAARLRLVRAVQTVLRNALDLMGMSAPEQM
jgi:arginyl-tRNA synthetase